MRNCLVETRWCYCNRGRVSCILSSQLFTPATSSSIGLQCLMLWWSLKWSFVVSDYLPVIILSFSFPFFLVSKSKNSWIVMISTTIMVCGDQLQMSTNRRFYCDFNFRLSIEGSCFCIDRKPEGVCLSDGIRTWLRVSRLGAVSVLGSLNRKLGNPQTCGIWR